jgi:hypothetical protein
MTENPDDRPAEGARITKRELPARRQGIPPAPARGGDPSARTEREAAVGSGDMNDLTGI